MSVRIGSVIKGSKGYRKGIRPGDTLVSLNGHEIFDVLDYRFYGDTEDIRIDTIDGKGRYRSRHFKCRQGVDDLGIDFQTYLMDKKQSCRNKCIFCFVDQMPPGMRSSLYFKDDDSRLSFFFGNYITLTAISEREVRRIVEMHISPINISVHTMDPELRVRMMGNPHAGEKLGIIGRFAEAGIRMNTQLVLCPGINDGEHLRFSLEELAKYYPQVQSIAAVPVGLTAHRQGLYPLRQYDRSSAAETLDIIDDFNDRFHAENGCFLCYAADEFYLKACRTIPDLSYYGELSQLENGVGMWALTKQSFLDALSACKQRQMPGRKVVIATGEAAFPLISELIRLLRTAIGDVDVNVVRVANRFFGESVTVAGLLTGKDLKEQLSGTLTEDCVLLLSSSLLKSPDERVFLDDLSVEELSASLRVPIEIVGETDGGDLLYHILGS